MFLFHIQKTWRADVLYGLSLYKEPVVFVYVCVYMCGVFVSVYSPEIHLGCVFVFFGTPPVFFFYGTLFIDFQHS